MCSTSKTTSFFYLDIQESRESDVTCLPHLTMTMTVTVTMKNTKSASLVRQTDSAEPGTDKLL